MGQSLYGVCNIQGEKIMTEVTKSDFNEVLESGSPVFACFTGSKCETCFALCLVANNLAKEYEGRVKFVKVNVEKNPELVANYHIVALPSVIFFRDSKPVKSRLGFHYQGSLRKLLDGLLEEEEHSAQY